MDPEERQLVQKTLELVEENNRMLHKIRRAQKIASFTRTFYWVVILGAAVGAFYFLQPYIDNISKFVDDTKSIFGDIKENLPR